MHYSASLARFWSEVSLKALYSVLVDNKVSQIATTDFLCSYIPTVVLLTTLNASSTTKTPKLCFHRHSGRGQMEGAREVLCAADLRKSTWVKDFQKAFTELLVFFSLCVYQ